MFVISYTFPTAYQPWLSLTKILTSNSVPAFLIIDTEPSCSRICGESCRSRRGQTGVEKVCEAPPWIMLRMEFLWKAFRARSHCTSLELLNKEISYSGSLTSTTVAFFCSSFPEEQSLLGYLLLIIYCSIFTIEISDKVGIRSLASATVDKHFEVRCFFPFFLGRSLGLFVFFSDDS